MSWKCHVASSTNSRYDRNLGRYVLTALGLYLEFSENIIIGGDGPFKGCSETMLDAITYDFKPLTDRKFKPEESFIKVYANECLESRGTITSTCRIRRILDAKYKNNDLNQLMD